MTRLKQWLREPLLYFLLIGAALFVVYRVLNPSPQADTRSGLIELTQDDLVQMSVAWLAQGRPSLTAEQMQSLVEHRVREEILYREAIELGLDKGDTIVRRRLASLAERHLLVRPIDDDWRAPGAAATAFKFRHPVTMDLLLDRIPLKSRMRGASPAEQRRASAPRRA